MKVFMRLIKIIFSKFGEDWTKFVACEQFLTGNLPYGS